MGPNIIHMLAKKTPIAHLRLILWDHIYFSTLLPLNRVSYLQLCFVLILHYHEIPSCFLVRSKKDFFEPQDFSNRTFKVDVPFTLHKYKWQGSVGTHYKIFGPKESQMSRSGLQTTFLHTHMGTDIIQVGFEQKNSAGHKMFCVLRVVGDTSTSLSSHLFEQFKHTAPALPSHHRFASDLGLLSEMLIKSVQDLKNRAKAV